MHRYVSRRSVVKLAYAVPVVAASLRISEASADNPWLVLACPTGQSQCDCLGGDVQRFRPTGAEYEDGPNCGSCDPGVADGPGCSADMFAFYHSGDLNCVAPGGHYIAWDVCFPAIRPFCQYCGPGDLISRP